LGVLGITALLYLGVELCFWVFYDPALDLYPGFSEEVARMNYALYEFDPVLIRRMPPHLDTVHPKSLTPMRTNSLGYRGPEFSIDKPPGRFRILFMGDSCVYGFGLREEDSIPRQVERLLAARGLGEGLDVINLAVPGYTSFQGRRQAENLFDRMKPDAVVIGFGFNDSTVRNHSEAEVQASLSGGGPQGLSRILGYSPLFEFIQIKFRKAVTKSNIGVDSLVIDKEKGPVSRVPLTAYEENIRAIIDTAERVGARCVLLDINLANFHGLDRLAGIAREQGLDFVHARSVLEQAAPPEPYVPVGKREAGRAFAIQVGFPKEAVERAGQPFLARVPLGQVRYPISEVPLQDDGEGGDLKAEDGIFTALLEDPGRRDFEFSPAFDLMKVGINEEAFLNYTTFYRLPDPRSLEPNTLYRSPVIRFRRPTFKAYLVHFDLVHPNKAGTDLISRALLPALERLVRER
jgi:lysophospholipase L1-like esterase